MPSCTRLRLPRPDLCTPHTEGPAPVRASSSNWTIVVPMHYNWIREKKTLERANERGSKQMKHDGNDELCGVAERFSLDFEEDEDYEELVNTALALAYPDVSFEHRGGSDYNLLVNGNGWKDVSDQIDYEPFWTATPDELAAFIASKKG